MYGAVNEYVIVNSSSDQLVLKGIKWEMMYNYILRLLTFDCSLLANLSTCEIHRSFSQRKRLVSLRSPFNFLAVWWNILFSLYWLKNYFDIQVPLKKAAFGKFLICTFQRVILKAISCQSYTVNEVLCAFRETSVAVAMFLVACKLETFLGYWEEIENWCTKCLSYEVMIW